MDSRQLGAALAPLVDRVVESYFADERTQHIDRAFLPPMHRAVRIADLLLELTYPGYVGRQRLTRHNISYHVGELVPRLWEHLAGIMTDCLCHEADQAEETKRTPQCEEAASTLATRFVERIPDVRRMLADDTQAHFDGDPAALSLSEIILAYPGLLAITVHRYAHELYLLDVPLLPRMISEHAHRMTGIDIHPGARIGRSFCIDHGTGVVIGETSTIGDNVKIYQGVTLGALSFPKDERGRLIRGQKRHPTVGNNVTVYANAIILGGETVIGDGAVVGGSVFLTKSVAPDHQVSINPPVLKIRPPRPKSKTDKPTPDDFVMDFSI